MRRKWVVLAMALALTAACGKKLEPQGVTSNPVSSAPGGSSETKPFVMPPTAKKQEKYFPEGTPSRSVQDLDDMLESYIMNAKTPDEKQYNENLKRAVIHGTFDIGELCRLALDKHWGERNSQEQTYFVDLMTHLLEKKAIFTKEQGQKKEKTKVLYHVTYEGHKFLNPDKTSALAMSMVHIPSESLNIELNYKLKKVSAGSGWMIYDVIVDGASLLDNYKYQFDKIIAKEGYAILVHRMESKLKELEEKGQERTEKSPLS